MANPNQSPPPSPAASPSPAAARADQPPQASAPAVAGDTAGLAGGSAEAAEAAAAEAMPSSPRVDCLSLQELDLLINNQNWTGLNDYLKRFMDDGDHPEVFIHCHRGKLIDLLRSNNVSEANNFFSEVIAPLGQTFTPYASSDHIKSLIDDIKNSLSSNRHLEHPNNMVNLIKDYCRLNFPEQVGHENQGHSKMWSFALKLDRQEKKVKFRCLLCGNEGWSSHITRYLQHHLTNGCPKITDSVRQRLALGNASKVNQKQKSKRQAGMLDDNRTGTNELNAVVSQHGEQLNAKDQDELQNIKEKIATAKGCIFDLMIAHNIGGDDPICKMIKECFDNINQSAEQMNQESLRAGSHPQLRTAHPTQFLFKEEPPVLQKVGTSTGKSSGISSLTNAGAPNAPVLQKIDTSAAKKYGISSLKNEGMKENSSQEGFGVERQYKVFDSRKHPRTAQTTDEKYFDPKRPRLTGTFGGTSVASVTGGRT